MSPTPCMRCKAAISSVLAVSLMLLISTTAFADSETDSGNAVFSIFLTVRSVFIPLAAVGVAGSALQMVFGDERSAASAKKRIIVILAAVAAVWLIPSVLTAGRDSLISAAWDPSNPG